ncbi:MAG: hypothetical protein F6J98_11200 [Moorea sp. SIO4G2]|nr:hypothetical protein [Moorena sp. SIO4G2]
MTKQIGLLDGITLCDRTSAEAEALAFGPRYANGHALRSRSVGFAETLHRVAALKEHHTHLI